MISKCTTGCPMVTPFVPSVQCPQGTGLTVVTNPPPRTHRRRPAAFPRKRRARHARNRPDYTELHSFAWGGMLTRDVTSTCQPEGRSGMMGGLEPEGESVSVDTSVPHIAR